MAMVSWLPKLICICIGIKLIRKGLIGFIIVYVYATHTQNKIVTLCMVKSFFVLYSLDCVEFPLLKEFAY